MLEVTATEAAKRFSQIRQAAQREPVAVTHHGRITEVLISKLDYDEYMRLKGSAARVIAPAREAFRAQAERLRAQTQGRIVSNTTDLIREDRDSH